MSISANANAEITTRGSTPPAVFFASKRGSALLAALCFATVLAITLGGYLSLCRQTLQLSTRNVYASQAVQLAETGMEDALWALNKQDWSTWAISGTTATKTLTGFDLNGATGRISLSITNYDGVSGTRTVTATGTTTQADGTSVSRALTSSHSRATLLNNAVAATTGTVRFASAGTVDSYDSSLGSYTSQTPTYSAIISSGSTLASAATVQLTNAQVKGYVATLSTGPSYSTSAKLIGPTTSVTLNIDPSRISTSPYQPIFTEAATSGVATVLGSGVGGIGVAGVTTLYTGTDLALNGGQTLRIDGPVVLVLSGNLTITQNAKIRVTSTGSLELHVAGNVVLGGNGIVNDTGLPKNFILITSGTTNTVDMTTTNSFYGVIYAPNTGLTVGNNATIFGALVAKSVTFNGSPVIHYDLALRNATFSSLETPFAVSGWRETNAQ